MVLAHREPQVLLRLELDLPVDRELQVGAGLGLCWIWTPPAISWPIADSSTVRTPGVPASAASYCRSRPVMPTPSTLTTPTTCAAIDPPG